MNKIKMLYFDRTDVSEAIGFNKTSSSEECDICHNWYFLNKELKCQWYVCNRCHVLLMPINLNDIAILKIKNTNYRCNITWTSNSEAIKVLKNIYLKEKSGTL